MEHLVVWIFALSLGALSYGSPIDIHYADAMYAYSRNVFVQKGLTHHVRCPTWRPEERLNLAYWDKGEVLITRFAASPQVGTNYTLNHRFSVSGTFGLIVKSVEAADGGDYLCTISSINGVHRQETVSITVLDKKFASVDEDMAGNKTNVILQRGYKHEMQCPLPPTETSATKDTIYWTLDISQANYTDIIGAKYSDGETMVTEGFSTGYDIKADGMLVISPLTGSRSRYWCHLFRYGSDKSSGYVDVVGKVVTEQTSPRISMCDVSDDVCDVMIEEEDIALNCSVTDIYPEVQLTWEHESCDLSVSQPLSFVVFYRVDETFDQFSELIIPANSSIINCTLQCVAAGAAVTNSPITKTVYVRGQVESQGKVEFVVPSDKVDTPDKSDAEPPIDLPQKDHADKIILPGITLLPDKADFSHISDTKSPLDSRHTDNSGKLDSPSKVHLPDKVTTESPPNLVSRLLNVGQISTTGESNLGKSRDVLSDVAVEIKIKAPMSVIIIVVLVGGGIILYLVSKWRRGRSKPSRDLEGGASPNKEGRQDPMRSNQGQTVPMMASHKPSSSSEITTHVPAAIVPPNIFNINCGENNETHIKQTPGGGITITTRVLRHIRQAAGTIFTPIREVISPTRRRSTQDKPTETPTDKPADATPSRGPAGNSGRTLNYDQEPGSETGQEEVQETLFSHHEKEEGENVSNPQKDENKEETVSPESQHLFKDGENTHSSC